MDPEVGNADDLQRKLMITVSTSSHGCCKYHCAHREREFKDIIALKSISPL